LESELPAADRKTINPAINSEAAEGMAKCGITRVPVDYFHYKEFRYTNLDDAIAQATRQNGRQRSRPQKQLWGLFRRETPMQTIDPVNNKKQIKASITNAIAKLVTGSNRDEIARRDCSKG
jgi:hypothetical protein